MGQFTIGTARTWLVQSGCEPSEVDDAFYFFLLGLADDRHCDMLEDPSCDDVPITSAEVRLLRGEIITHTLINRYGDIDVGMYLRTGAVRAWIWTRSPRRRTKREQLDHFRRGRMAPQPDNR